MTRVSCLYRGRVVHKRLRPKPHALGYDVFSMFLDVDSLGELSKRLSLFSYNRFNAVSLYDRDHGSGDGATVAQHARATLANAGLANAGVRIFLLCYPRIFGFTFNPISVFYGFDAQDRLAAVIYEVNNTFGERRSYVVGLQPDGASGVPHTHGCDKAMYVSPFTDMDVRYSFRLSNPADELVLGVALRDGSGPLLKTHFRGSAVPLTDRALASLLIALPLLTVKIVGAIHIEALCLWLKGVPLTTKPAAPRYGVTLVEPEVPAPLPLPTTTPPAVPLPTLITS